MLQLKNIQNNERYISANYLPEGSSVEGFIKIDKTTGEIVEQKKADGYGLMHAISALQRLLDTPSTVKLRDRVVSWY
ncbi:MAG: hypothetical protein QM296_03910 [Bacillota bacterium]|nr:hypothetical protein [Bacillota bacterium]